MPNNVIRKRAQIVNEIFGEGIPELWCPLPTPLSRYRR